jgi:hypothetical protein
VCVAAPGSSGGGESGGGKKLATSMKNAFTKLGSKFNLKKGK